MSTYLPNILISIKIKKYPNILISIKSKEDELEIKLVHAILNTEIQILVYYEMEATDYHYPFEDNTSIDHYE